MFIYALQAHNSVYGLRIEASAAVAQTGIREKFNIINLSLLLPIFSSQSRYLCAFDAHSYVYVCVCIQQQHRVLKM